MKTLIHGSEYILVLRLKRHMTDEQKIVFIGGVPVVVDKTKFDKFKAALRTKCLLK